MNLLLLPDSRKRSILIAFDRDSNPQTVTRVKRARKSLARLFAELGCETRSSKWDDQYKGLDDFIFGAGQESLDKAIESAQNFEYIFGIVQEYLEESVPNFSPDYGFTWQLPRPYSADIAQWENIDRFLNSLCVNNQQLKELAIAFCAAILTGRSDLHKFLYLFGSGRNGKGVFSKLLSMLIGKENTHSTAMTELNGNRFEPANLRGKRLVLMSDEDKYTGGIGILKSASGGDPLRHEDKGKKAGQFYFRGMIVISANSPTFVGSGGFALFSRKIDFPCLAKIAENDRRDIAPELELDLTAFTTYLLSLSNEWVTNTLRGAGSVEAVKKLNWEMTTREDSIAAFYSDKLIIDPNGSIPCGQLYKGYQSYCEDSSLKPKSLNNFTPSLIELCNDSLGHSIAKKKASGNNVINGIRLREDWEFEDDISVTTGEKYLFSSINKNQNFSTELERYPQPPLSIQNKGLEPPLVPPQVSTSIHTTSVVNTDLEPLTEF